MVASYCTFAIWIYDGWALVFIVSHVKEKLINFNGFVVFYSLSFTRHDYSSFYNYLLTVEYANRYPMGCPIRTIFDSITFSYFSFLRGALGLLMMLEFMLYLISFPLGKDGKVAVR